MRKLRRALAKKKYAALDIYHPPLTTLQAYVTQYPELRKITDNHCSTWLGEWTTDPVTKITNDKNAAGTKVIHYVVYAAPYRDAGGYSAGGFPTVAEYLAWIDKIVQGIGSASVLITLEPDTLGLIDRQTPTAQTELYSALSQAVTKLKQGVNTKVFIDIGLWLATSEAATRLKNANVTASDGFALNTSNFIATPDCYTIGENYLSALSSQGIAGKKYTIDTSRNGNGRLTNDFPNSAPWFAASKTWCNPPGRGLGPTARKPLTQPNCHALLWSKTPGQSDGPFPLVSENAYFKTDAPAAGGFWLEYARDIANNTPTNFDII